MKIFEQYLFILLYRRGSRFNENYSLEYSTHSTNMFSNCVEFVVRFKRNIFYNLETSFYPSNAFPWRKYVIPSIYTLCSNGYNRIYFKTIFYDTLCNKKVR